jgi:hypothetical protein
MSGIWRMAGSNSGESCRLAPAATRARGTPDQSVATDRFVPLLAAVNWRAARKFPSAEGFGDRPVHRDVIEAEADHAVVGGEGSLEHLHTDTPRLAQSATRRRILRSEHPTMKIDDIQGARRAKKVSTPGPPDQDPGQQ